MFSTEQMDYLEKHFDDRYKRMFVQIDDCNDKQTEINKKFANDDKRIDRIMYLQEDANNKLTKNNWLTTAILTVIIGIVVTMILKTIGVF